MGLRKRSRGRGPNKRPLKVMLSVRIDADVHRATKAEAKRRRLRLTDFIEESLMRCATQELPPTFQKASFLLYNASTEEQEYVAAFLDFLRADREKLCPFLALERDTWKKKLVIRASTLHPGPEEKKLIQQQLAAILNKKAV